MNAFVVNHMVGVVEATFVIALIALLLAIFCFARVTR